MDLLMAEHMPALLEQIARSGRYGWSLGTLAPKPLMTGTEESMLFSMVCGCVSRDAADILQYLRALEGLPEHFYWRRLDYQVEQYPEAEASNWSSTPSVAARFIRG